MINLLDFDRKGMEAFFNEHGAKISQAKQVFQQIHQYGMTEFTQSKISKRLAQHLQTIAYIKSPKLVMEKQAQDGTIKWLLGLEDGNCIETIFIPEVGRGTLCVSSQVGCALNCSFCATARQGFSRNLTVAEIIGQVWFATRRLSACEGIYSSLIDFRRDAKRGRRQECTQKYMTAATEFCNKAENSLAKSIRDRKVTNIVMMGMGEPLLNFANVVSAMEIMMDDLAYGLSKYRVTLSTAGVVPAMRQLAKASNVSLAVSLHAPDDALRNKLVPINKKYPLDQLLQTCKDYYQGDKRRKIIMEYVMLKNVNDAPAHAEQLVKILQGMAVKVNLIPFNTCTSISYECSEPQVIEIFRSILSAAGFTTLVRKTRGDDIAAACGQLVGRLIDKTQRKSNYSILTDQATESSTVVN